MRRPTRTRPALAAIGAAAALTVLGVAGCGEKEEPETTGPVVAQSTSPIDGTETTTSPDAGKTDQQLVEEAARSFLTSTDAAAVCDEGITPELLATVYGDRAGCLAARKPQSLAKTVQLGPVQLGQGTATLTANASGGVFGNAQRLKLTVVRDGTGAWRVSKVAPGAPVGR